METTQTQTQNINARGRMVLLNGLPLNALPQRPLRLHVTPMGLQELVSLAQRGLEIIHFIRHVGTLQALREAGIPVTEPNAGLYVYRNGDMIIAVVLNAPQRGQEVQRVRPEDLSIWQILVEVAH